MPRPQLPVKHANPYLKNATSLPPVKYQILSCQGAEILVGRLKIEVPEGGHAFILRRFDTDAISVTTMFRAAFPTSSEADERVEVQYIRDNFDLAGNNGSSREPHLTRLAGTWVNCATAMELAGDYGLGSLVNQMVAATPDPNANYRRSQKGQSNQAAATTTTTTTTTHTIAQTHAIVNGSPVKPSSKTSALPTPSPTSGEPAAKRRKESSPAPVPQIPVPATPVGSKTPVRRSARAKSPAVKSGPVPLTGLSSKPRSRSSVAPASPKKTAQKSPVKGDEDVDELEDGVAGVAGEQLYEEDVREQKELVEELKRKRDAARAAQEEMEADEEEDEEEEGGPSKLKRARHDGEEPLRFDFKEPETEERQIATNRRVGRFAMEPRTKSIAWGIAAFAVGMSAVSFLPNFF
ncbi:hypothetical protein FA13DRAFT_1686136 [Coprinellus micaceus]|uniref:HTH APSES-type domain-containing protein n=1 Tax=Coprinellus micaceus TaxID=71717 RepID=A0A4Y7THK2_COPMI|nr:hypothetical protein FA13DRAFT_1686136 [Coprinellus micaceus]